MPPWAAYPPEPAPLAQLEGVRCVQATQVGCVDGTSHAACEPSCPPVLMARDTAKLSDVPALRRHMRYFRIKKYAAPSTGHWLPSGSLKTLLHMRTLQRDCRTKLAMVHLQSKAEWQVLAGPRVMLRVSHGQQTKNV